MSTEKTIANGKFICTSTSVTKETGKVHGIVLTSEEGCTGVERGKEYLVTISEVPPKTEAAPSADEPAREPVPT